MDDYTNLLTIWDRPLGGVETAGCYQHLAALVTSGAVNSPDSACELSNDPLPPRDPVKIAAECRRNVLFEPSVVVGKYGASQAAGGSMPDRMCALYSPVYALIGPFGLKIWNETEPRNGTTVAWKIGAWEDLASITIWMDGRPHPSKNAPHENSGFTTGVWEDDVLTTYTTHVKAGTFRRNGVPSSDQTTMTARFLRHGDLLTVTARMEEPIYLAEPLYMTRAFQLSSAQPVLSVGNPCIPANEGVPEGAVPHYLPGENPFMNEMMRMYNVPVGAALGGPETMYPEYRKKLKDRYVPPAQCKRDCGGPAGFPLRTN